VASGPFFEEAELHEQSPHVGLIADHAYFARDPRHNVRRGAGWGSSAATLCGLNSRPTKLAYSKLERFPHRMNRSGISESPEV
jgi:hypothetical protein